jgi:hypothetical protein
MFEKKAKTLVSSRQNNGCLDKKCACASDASLSTQMLPVGSNARNNLRNSKNYS